MLHENTEARSLKIFRSIILEYEIKIIMIFGQFPGRERIIDLSFVGLKLCEVKSVYDKVTMSKQLH